MSAQRNKKQEIKTKARSSPWSIDDFIHDNSVSFFLGLAIALLMASLAAAGINTIWVARIFLALSLLSVAALLYGSTWGMRVSARLRFAILLALAVGSVAIERFETWYQPSPQKMQIPPLKLMMRPAELWTIRHPVILPEMGITLDYVERPTGGYAAFTSNQKDDVMFGIQNVEIVNLNDFPIRLSWSLAIKGEGRSLNLNGNGKGRWERQLNKNDWFAKRSSKLSWKLSPMEIGAGKKVWGDLGFVVQQADDALKNDIVHGKIDSRYTFDLSIIDLNSKNKTVLPLPFGIKPTPNTKLREVIEKLEKN